MKRSITVISVGGSLIAPDKIDVKFLHNFRRLIIKHLKHGHRFILICGGGGAARTYQNAARKIGKPASADLDWLGIHGTRINAHLLRTIFGAYAHKKIIKPDEQADFKEAILVGGGWKPGWSTDYCAVKLAERYGAARLLNLSNISFVFDRDPRVYKSAKPQPELTWTQFRKMIPKKWSPGLSSPFDPVASREAQKNRLEVAIINGEDFKSIDNYLKNRAFHGTVIKPAR